MNTTKAITIIISAIVIVAGTYLVTALVNRRSKTSNADWAIGGRDLPLYVVVGTQFATCFGGGVLVAQVGNAFSNGFSVLLYGFYIGISYFILMIIAKWLRGSGFVTIPDILNNFCGGFSKRVTILGALLAMIVPFGWIGGQVVAFAKLYSPITGISMNWLIVIVCLISLFFVMPAGLKTVAWTDFFFSCIILTMCAVILGKAVIMGGGISQVISNIPKELVTFPDFIDKLGWRTALMWTFAIFPGNMTNQVYYQRICAIKNEKEVNRSLALSGILGFLAFCWSCAMGLTIRTINPGLEPELATGWLMSTLSLPLLAMFAGLLVATIMSSISSAVQCAVVSITSDLYPVINPNASEERKLHLSRVWTVIVLAVAAVLCTLLPDVLGWFTYAYTFSAAALLCPIFVGYAMRKKPGYLTEQGFFFSMIFGIGGCVVSMLIPSPIPDVCVGIVTSLIALLLVSKATRKSVVPIAETASN